MVEIFGHCWFEPTNQDLIKVPVVYKSTNEIACIKKMSARMIYRPIVLPSHVHPEVKANSTLYSGSIEIAPTGWNLFF